MMTAVDKAEQMARVRAVAFLLFSGLSVALMAFNLGPLASDFTRGFWLGVLAGSALNLMPIKRWLRPKSEVVRLMEDDGARENRRLSCVAGFWASALSAIVISGALVAGANFGPLDVSEIIATAAIAAAMLAFAMLELRAAR